jgi:hypothetical protein
MGSLDGSGKKSYGAIEVNEDFGSWDLSPLVRQNTLSKLKKAASDEEVVRFSDAMPVAPWSVIRKGYVIRNLISNSGADDI